jgi:penicillin amidase
MRWAGAEISDQVEAFNKIDRASNWKEFVAGVRGFSGPGQNFVYGDIDGNIGYWCGVKLPDRGRQSSILPLPGWDKSSEWKGFVPFDELPHRYNPPEGYVASANNKIVDDSYPYHISDLWEPPSRIVRLTEVLGKGGSFSIEDFERLQNDKFSHHAEEMMPYVLHALSESSPGFSESELMLEYLRNWDFIFAKDDVATTLFQQFFVKLLENIYRDEMGDEVFHDFVMLANIPIRVTAKLIEEGKSSWFDDIRTDTLETRDDIIRKSMKESVLALRERLDTEMKGWRWGEVHTVTLQHPFGLQKPLDEIFNVGPFPYGGGPTSLVSGEYSYSNPFAVTVGASFRWIVDFSKPDEPRALLPPGQSGHAMHNHYDDQTQLWLNGAYRIAHVHRSLGQLPPWDRLTLEPSR